MARIVVVESDARVRGAIVKILQSRGHEVVDVADAGAAIKSMQAQPAALLLADFTTLGSERNAVVTRLRASAPRIPTILLADSRSELIEASASAASEGAGMMLGLKKPLRRQALLDTIARALAIHAAAGAGAKRRNLSLGKPGATRSKVPAETPRKVLVVDADDAIRRAMRRALEKAGFTVYAASDGNEAVALFTRHRPEVAIVEIVLPGKDGVTTIGEIRMLSPDAMIIAMSGADPSAPEANLSIAWMYGASRSLEKPFRMADLLDTLDELMSETAASQSGERAANERLTRG